MAFVFAIKKAPAPDPIPGDHIWTEDYANPANWTVADELVTKDGAVANRSISALPKMSSGKWYYEVEQGVVPAASLHYHGVVNEAGLASLAAAYLYTLSNAWTINAIGGLTTNSVAQANYDSQGSSPGFSFNYNGAILMVAVDADSGKLYFGYNGLWGSYIQQSASLPSDAGFTGLTGPFYPAFSAYYNGTTATLLPDSADQKYTPPTGFLSMDAVRDEKKLDVVWDPIRSDVNLDWTIDGADDRIIMKTKNSYNRSAVCIPWFDHGRLYWEMEIINAGTEVQRIHGIAGPNWEPKSYSIENNGYGFSANGRFEYKGVAQSWNFPVTFGADGDIVQWLVDFNTTSIYLGVNGTWGGQTGTHSAPTEAVISNLELLTYTIGASDFLLGRGYKVLSKEVDFNYSIPDNAIALGEYVQT